jgi:hypothetical protein
MDRSTRIAVPALIVATVVCGALAAAFRSEVLGVAAAVSATLVVVVGLSVAGRSEPPETVSSGHVQGATSTTIGVVELPRPVALELHESSLAQATSFPIQSTEPQPNTTLSEDLEPAAYSPKLPPGTEPKDVVEALLAAARAAGRPLSAHLWLVDHATESLRLVDAVGRWIPEAVPVSAHEGLLGQAATDGETHIGPVGIVEGMSLWRYVLPLSGADLQGVAAVDFDEMPRLDVLTTISATLRASLSGALALHVARAETYTARVLVETCAALALVLDPADVLRTALDSAMELSNSQTGSIMILDPDTRRMQIAVARGLPEEIVAQTDIAEGDGIAGWVATSRQPLVIEDLNERSARSRRHGVRSAVCVPLADDDGVIGVLSVGSTQFHPRFSEATLGTLEALGKTVVVALRNAWATDSAHDLYFDTLKALALALEARDPYSHGATERIVEITGALSDYFGMSVEDRKALRVASMLHDVGMGAAGTNVAEARGPLTTVEWGMLKMHPVIAAEILSEAPALKDVVPIVYHHHEHFDGTGYVAGLAGSQIPLGARILAVVDAYVAMTSGRPFRRARTHREAVLELQRQAGSQFDPSIVQAVIDVVGTPMREGLLVN